MLDDGRRSCDIPIKNVKAPPQAKAPEPAPVKKPVIKTRDRGTQTLKEITTADKSKSKEQSTNKPKVGQKRVRSEKQASPDKIMREISFGAEKKKSKVGKEIDINAVISPVKRKKTEQVNKADGSQAMDASPKQTKKNPQAKATPTSSPKANPQAKQPASQTKKQKASQ